MKTASPLAIPIVVKPCYSLRTYHVGMLASISGIIIGLCLIVWAWFFLVPVLLIGVVCCIVGICSLLVLPRLLQQDKDVDHVRQLVAR
jgi:fatty acid desaturase